MTFLTDATKAEEVIVLGSIPHRNMTKPTVCDESWGYCHQLLVSVNPISAISPQTGRHLCTFQKSTNELRQASEWCYRVT